MCEKRRYMNLGRYLLAVLLCMMFVVGGRTQAGAYEGEDLDWVPAGAPKFPKEVTVYFKEYSKDNKKFGPEMEMISGDNFPNIAFIGDGNSDYKVSKIRQSNPKVAEVEYLSNVADWRNLTIYVKPKFKKKELVTGKTKVTFTVIKKGKRYPLSCEIIIRKAPNPFKSLKINGKDYTSSFKRYWNVKVKVNKKAKIAYKLKEEYKVYYYNKKFKKRVLKSGSTVKAPKYIWVDLKQKLGNGVPSGEHSIEFVDKNSMG